MPTFLVEHYRPGLDEDGLRQTAARVRTATLALEREGRCVHYVRSTLVPGDEAFLSVFEAASEGVVREAYGRAGATFERISRAIQIDT